jgi:hypothetical protein
MKINSILRNTALLAAMGGMMLTSCEESELYNADAPAWVADSISAVAIRNAANAGEGIDKNSLGTLFETFSSTDWNWPKLHVEAQVGTWKFTSSDGKYTDVEIVGSAWWSPQSIDANADGSNWTSSDFDLALDQELLLTFIPQTENAVVMWEFYGNGYWTTMSEGNWWFADDGDMKPGETATGSTSGYSTSEMGMYHWAPGSVVNVLVTKSGKTTTLAVYGPTIEDYEASSIKLEGIKSTREFSADLTLDQIVENATITVGFNDDAFSKQVDLKDCHLSVSPDLTTPGMKTVTAIYYLTNEGEAGNPVVGTYNVNIVNKVESITVATMPNNTIYYLNSDGADIKFDPTGIVVKSNNGDVLTNDVLTFSNIKNEKGTQTVTITYSDGISTTIDVTVTELVGDDILFKGKIIGSGKFVEDETFGLVFENDNSAQRTSYLLLPEGTIPDCSESKAMTISFWVNGNGKAFIWSPIFAAYAAAPVDNSNTFPMFIIQGRGLLQTNIEGWNDFTGAQNTTGANTESVAYLEDNQWHLVTVTITDKHAEFIVDNTVVNAWDYTGEGDGQVTTGFLSKGHEMLTYICLGGNQAWGWGDPDTGYKYAKLKTYDRVISAEEIAKRIADKE